MKIAYLILAHNNPKHLQRLVTALSSDSAGFFIHLDKKSNVANFSSIVGDNIHFIKKRIRVYWGCFSIVEATLNLLQTAFLDNANFDRFVLLSGADYPIRSTSYIESFFQNNPDKEFMDMHEASSLKHKITDRLALYTFYSSWPILNLIYHKLDERLKRVNVDLCMRMGPCRNYKLYLDGLTPYGCSQWWALSRDACDFILDFVENKKKVVKFLKNTVVPDESFFHIILGNSRFKSRIASSLTYTDWSGESSHPAYITENHLALFNKASSFTKDGALGNLSLVDGRLREEQLFARKFSDDSENLITKLFRL